MDDLKKVFGDDYPDAVTVLGMRLPLGRESRFLRHYFSEENRRASVVSKFEDGSATMTLAELREQWPTWSAGEKHEFINACHGLHRQGDYPDILRYLMRQDDPHAWSALAGQVGGWLPQEEAFELLTHALKSVESHSANITQGISITRHPGGAGILRAHLQKLWRHPGLWDDDPFTNWHAFDAICCIQHLIQLGDSPDEFLEQVRALSAHACAGTRESCATFLSSHYDWIPKPDLGPLGP